MAGAGCKEWSGIFGQRSHWDAGRQSGGASGIDVGVEQRENGGKRQPAEKCEEANVRAGETGFAAFSPAGGLSGSRGSPKCRKSPFTTVPDTGARALWQCGQVGG